MAISMRKKRGRERGSTKGGGERGSEREERELPPMFGAIDGLALFSDPTKLPPKD